MKEPQLVTHESVKVTAEERNVDSTLLNNTETRNAVNSTELGESVHGQILGADESPGHQT